MPAQEQQQEEQPRSFASDGHTSGPGTDTASGKREPEAQAKSGNGAEPRSDRTPPPEPEPEMHRQGSQHGYCGNEFGHHEEAARTSAKPTRSEPKPTPYRPPENVPTWIVHKRGMELLRDPLFNKGTAFTPSERDRLGLRGLVPPGHLTMEVQVDRIMEEYAEPQAITPEEAKMGGVNSEMTRKWRVLQDTQDRNEMLFHRILLDNFVDVAPIVYTPTVGWVCVNYHHLYRRPRGMFFSAKDRGEMAAMTWNWPQDKVQAIVVTDGSRILGLGDLGLNGLGIPVGKLDLYCAAAGFNPQCVLPVVIDVGTDNETLRNDKMYLGLKQPRIGGQEYYDILDEFVAAVTHRWPNAVLQFEDFSTQHAFGLLERYRKDHLVFNDDIQGTAATALAGLYGALRVLDLPQSALAKQRVLCVGAGSAGIGVVDVIRQAMVKQGASEEEALRNFYVTNSKGIVTQSRIDQVADHVKPYARPEKELEGLSLEEVVRKVNPTILLGLAGAGRLFTEQVLRALNETCKEQRPVVFPMSNPLSKMECSAEEAVRFTEGRAVVAVGSPQAPVEYNGRNYKFGQANNMYLFPGIAFGAYFGATRIVTDAMLTKAAEALPDMIPEEDVKEGLVYPRLEHIRDISVKVAVAIMTAAAEEGLLRGKAAEKLEQGGEEKLSEWVKDQQFQPLYSTMINLPLKAYE